MMVNLSLLEAQAFARGDYHEINYLIRLNDREFFMEEVVRALTGKKRRNRT